MRLRAGSSRVRPSLPFARSCTSITTTRPDSSSSPSPGTHQEAGHRRGPRLSCFRAPPSKELTNQKTRLAVRDQVGLQNRPVGFNSSARRRSALVAQRLVQPLRKRKVAGSNPAEGSNEDADADDSPRWRACLPSTKRRVRSPSSARTYAGAANRRGRLTVNQLCDEH